MGLTPDRSSLSATDGFAVRIRQRSFAVTAFRINRAGKRRITGGPGQLMGYPNMNLRAMRQDLHKYFAGWNNCASIFSPLDIAAQRRDRFTGVLGRKSQNCFNRVGVRIGSTMHGVRIECVRRSLAF